MDPTGIPAVAPAQRASDAGPEEQHPAPTGAPSILLTATLRWPLAARMAIALHDLGCRVQACAPPGHPLAATRAVERLHHCGTIRPQRALLAAIRAAAPDFIVPCDDQAALELVRLCQHSDLPTPAERCLIRHSLGKPSACVVATDRQALMELAAAEGLRVPAHDAVGTPGDLDHWAVAHGFPAVLKVDGTWGGLGVSVVNDIVEAKRAWRTLSRPSLARDLAHLVLRRDPSYLLRHFSRHRPHVTIQRFISGTPANRAVACWHGDVLAGISVRALQTQTATGPASVVQILDHAEMAAATKRLVFALGLSGFCGADFVIEAASGDAYLIEVNPRATPISHLELGSGRDLPAALNARLIGAPLAATLPAIRGDTVAMFPGEWRRDALSPYLRSAFHDVPWAELELVRDCALAPWSERGLAARLRAWLRPQQSPGAASAPSSRAVTTLERPPAARAAQR